MNDHTGTLRTMIHQRKDGPCICAECRALKYAINELSGREAVDCDSCGGTGEIEAAMKINDCETDTTMIGCPDCGGVGTTPQPGDGWIDRAAHAADELLSTVLEGFEPERSEHGLGTKHLAWMACELAEKRIDSPTKACRWLGYIQGALVQIGLTSLRAEKLRNQASAAPSAKGVA